MSGLLLGPCPRCGKSGHFCRCLEKVIAARDAARNGENIMGQWNISIHGTGCHHNAALKEDANRMAADFVRQLRAAGHSVARATITFGGEEDVTDAEKYLADKEAQDEEHRAKHGPK